MHKRHSDKKHSSDRDRDRERDRRDRKDDRDREKNGSSNKKRERENDDRSDRSSKRRRTSDDKQYEKSSSQYDSNKHKSTKKKEAIRKRLMAWKKKIKPELSSLFSTDDEPTKKKIGFLEDSIQDRSDLLIDLNKPQETTETTEPSEPIEPIEPMEMEIVDQPNEETEKSETIPEAESAAVPSSSSNREEKTKKWNERVKQRLLEAEKQQESKPKKDEKSSGVVESDGGYEVDPLDVYMADISEKAKELREKSLSKARNEADKRGTVEIEEEQEEEEDIDPNSSLPKRLQRKFLEDVDHSKIDYMPFRKNFYIEVPEIARLTEDETKLLRKELDGIKVRGKNCPKPIKSFTQCGLSNKVLAVLEKYQYDAPTPVQAQAIPAVMSGRDVIGIAKTGSGKTLAFLLPMFRHILDQPPLAPGDGPIGLIMAPTRELATQIHQECKKFRKATGLRSVCVYGGAGVQHQIGDLKRGAEIVVCTPGRMIDILCANRGRITNLKRVTILVLDEADRMFDMGFEPQITRIMTNIRPTRQTMLFSATFPKAVETAARKILKNPLELTVRGKGVVADTVEQHVEILEENQKMEKLMELISEWYDKGSILVFVDRQEAADQLWRDVLKSGYQCLSIHGGKDQLDRDFTIKDFKEGKIKILIATSVAARGLDVSHLRLVVNYDVPNHLEDYVHRVGRTGRAGNKGTAWTFITPGEDCYARDVYLAVKNSGQPCSDKLVKMVEDFEEKRKQGLVQKRKSGFTGGSGYKFDESEELAKAQAMKLQRMAYGVITEEDDEDELDELKRKVLEAKQPKGDIADKAKQDAAVNELTNPAVRETKEMLRHIEGESIQAEALDQILGNTDNVPIAATREERIQRAKMFAQELVIKTKESLLHASKQRFTEELDINDYPQAARWKVTHKDALASITEFTGCGITAKGQYYAPGRNPPLGARKLYLFIEGNSVDEVKRAKTEIKRILDEAVLTAHPDKAQYGKYSVV